MFQIFHYIVMYLFSHFIHVFIWDCDILLSTMTEFAGQCQGHLCN